MKRIIVSILMMISILIFPSAALAETPSTGWTGHGLYLLQDNDIYLNQMDVNITINADQTTFVEAKYELENKEDKTMNVYFGVPEQDVELMDFTSKVLPYRYGNKKVSGSEINKQVPGVKTDYKSWRTWYSPYKPGEKRTVEISYLVKNKYISEGRYLLSYQMDHIKSWKGQPNSVNVSVHFDSKEVEVYNFGNEYSQLPKVEEDFTLQWTLDTIEGNESIDFDYYSVDNEIIKFLQSKNSAKIKNIIAAYENKNYPEVIQLGKEYIQSPEGKELQKEIYFLMADAYQQDGQAEESLILYQLIEKEPIFHEGLQEKIQHFITYNKINSYLDTQEYKTLYRLILQVQKDDAYSFIYQDWAEDQIYNIPQKWIDQVIEEEREPEGFEKVWTEISNGDYNILFSIIGGVFLVILLISYIRNKKNKDKDILFKRGKR